MEEIDGEQRGREDADHGPVREAPGEVEHRDRGGAEQGRDEAADEVEERGIPGERPRDPAGRGAEDEPVDPCHHVHVQAGPVEEPGIEIPLVEADGPLDDARLVGVIEIRQTVRDAPGAEREPDGENESEPPAECLVRPGRGRGISRRTPRWELRFPKGSPHASPVSRAWLRSSAGALPRSRQDDAPAALDVQYATRALYNGQFRPPGQDAPCPAPDDRRPLASDPAGISAISPGAAGSRRRRSASGS